MLLPLVMSWNAPGALCASEYSIGLMFPSPARACAPVDTTYWFSSATIPAKLGADADVPPLGMNWPPLIKANGSWNQEAVSDTSGTSRAPSLGTPTPFCHD